MGDFFLVFACVMAADGLSDLLVNHDALDAPRNWARRLPLAGKLVDCRYCQTFWLLGAMSAGIIYGMPTAVLLLVVWAAMHRLCQLAMELSARLLNDAPIRVALCGTPGEDDEKRLQALDELAAQAQELDLGYEDKGKGDGQKDRVDS